MILAMFLLFQVFSVVQPISGAVYCKLRRPTTDSAPSSLPTGNGIDQDEGPRLDKSVATAWYPGWSGARFPPETLAWSKYTAVTYAFGVTTPDVNVISLEDSMEPLLPQFVSLAHNNDVKAFLSIGGWTGSIYFSPAVGSPENRTAFVRTILGLVDKYNLDGIDFDWEYPNDPNGLGCNIISPDDSAHFLLFLQELKYTERLQRSTKVPLSLTAAAKITPFNGPDGTPMSDVSAFADVLDYLAIMAYDIHGSWSQSGAGPNAPLNDTCAPNPQGSAVSAVRAWTAADFPASKLLLGVPAYGRSFYVEPAAAEDAFFAAEDAFFASAEDALFVPGDDIPATTWSYPPFDKSRQPLGDSLDVVEPDSGKLDQCGLDEVSGLPSGIWNFEGLVEAGYLTSDGEPNFSGDSNSRVYMFDECSQTPFMYDRSRSAVISYDDPLSFSAKGEFIRRVGLAGFAMWHALGDSSGILLDSITQAMEEESPCNDG